MDDIAFVYFGTGGIALGVLEELSAAKLMPVIVVTAPDRPAGRGHVLTPSPVATWAAENGIETLKPEKLDTEFIALLRERCAALGVKVFVLADYGKILPKALVELPEKGIVNMHPSLLPRLRGPSPIRSAILYDEAKAGVSVMLLDDKMDHGPILAQREVPTTDRPMRGRELDAILSHAGGVLLSETLPGYVEGSILPREQDHAAATYCRMFTKDMGQLDLEQGDPEENLRKINAFDGWPGTFAFFPRGDVAVRAKITAAHIENGRLVIDRLIPEGKREMDYREFEGR